MDAIAAGLCEVCRTGVGYNRDLDVFGEFSLLTGDRDKIKVKAGVQFIGQVLGLDQSKSKSRLC
ncbi:hypothetical protein MA16_Dca022614 [Dendrobium catenatum]|uniref:Uncharacterized protein n=1 Tax=Dendrobium catenatum TaxID=906689 RepID=A0A2I0X187_9ASPA|nr:hypothetical protein MA16_Dca022614 [Dendrobium catenatum]